MQAAGLPQHRRGDRGTQTRPGYHDSLQDPLSSSKMVLSILLPVLRETYIHQVQSAKLSLGGLWVSLTLILNGLINAICHVWHAPMPEQSEEGYKWLKIFCMAKVLPPVPEGALQEPPQRSPATSNGP